MKTIPVQKSSLTRSAQSLAVAFIAAGLCASVAVAQSPSGAGGPSPSSTTQRGSSSSSGSGSSSSAAPQAYGASASSSSGNASMSTASRDTNNSGASLKRADRRFITKAVESNQKELAASQLAAQRATNPEIRSFAQQIATEHLRMEQELTQLAQSKGVALENVSAFSTSASGELGSARASTRSADSGMSASADVSTNAGIATDHGAPRATGAAGTANTPASAGIATNSSTATSGAAGSWTGSSDDMRTDRHVRSLARKTGHDFDRDYVDLMVDAHEDTVRLFQRAAKDAQDSEVRSFASSHLSALQAHLDQANSLMKSAAE